MEQQHSEREMRQLAERLLFDVQAHDGRFTLTRTVDVPAPVRHENLTLKQAVEILESFGNYAARTAAELHEKARPVMS